MLKPTVKQMEFELNRLSNITYEIVFKYYKVTQDRIENLIKLIRKMSTNKVEDIADKYRLITKCNIIVNKFNALCNHANGTPQSY